ncbi:MAG TPA: hypothetical protein VHK69_17470, partial [Chitinophagaceae bacterium]|nr:hypothetical protein [Chitinophagaceae bacterium]
MNESAHSYLWPEIKAADLTGIRIQQQAAGGGSTDAPGYFDLHPYAAEQDGLAFLFPGPEPVRLQVRQLPQGLAVHCSCTHASERLCGYGVRALFNIAYRDDLRLFFDPVLRRKKMQAVADSYGLGGAPDLDAFFIPYYENGQAKIRPRSASLVPVAGPALQELRAVLQLDKGPRLPLPEGEGDTTETVLVWSRHKYTRKPLCNLYKASRTREGKLKHPLVPVDLIRRLAETGDEPTRRFLAALARLNQAAAAGNPPEESDLSALLRNPAGLHMFASEDESSDTVAAIALKPVSIRPLGAGLHCTVTRKGSFYEWSAQVGQGAESFPLAGAALRLGLFLDAGSTWYLPEDGPRAALLQYFLRKGGPVTVHASGFEAFRASVLEPLEEKVPVHYAFLPAGTAEP